jgi:hypothetical protein
LQRELPLQIGCFRAPSAFGSIWNHSIVKNSLKINQLTRVLGGASEKSIRLSRRCSSSSISSSENGEPLTCQNLDRCL